MSAATSATTAGECYDDDVRYDEAAHCHAAEAFNEFSTLDMTLGGHAALVLHAPGLCDALPALTRRRAVSVRG